MKCDFCDDTIHFWEQFYAIGKLHFHIQLLTLNSTIRCKRVNNKDLEAQEKKFNRQKVKI